MLTLDRLTFSRGDFSLSADWSLEPGARVALLGPSGGGKSTLLSLVAGFETPNHGHVRWDGQDLTTTRPGARPMSILFQEGNLFPHLTLMQNVGMGLSSNLKLSQAQRDKVENVLRRVGLGDLGARNPGALSGGQRARAALARVLLRGKPILLLDEAFSALGPALKQEMFVLLDETISPESIVMMVTHDSSEATRMADIVVVDAGLASAPVPSGPLLADPPPGLKAYLGK